YGLGVFNFLNASNSDADNSDSSRAIQLFHAKFSNTNTDVILLLRSKTLKVTDAAFAQAATVLLSTLNKRPEVALLTSYYGTQSTDFISGDGHETFVLIQLKGQSFFTKQHEYTSLKPELSSQTLIVLTGGHIPADIAVDQQTNDDLQRAETL